MMSFLTSIAVCLINFNTTLVCSCTQAVIFFIIPLGITARLVNICFIDSTHCTQFLQVIFKTWKKNFENFKFHKKVSTFSGFNLSWNLKTLWTLRNYEQTRSRATEARNFFETTSWYLRIICNILFPLKTENFRSYIHVRMPT